MASFSIRFGIDYKLMKKGRYFCWTLYLLGFGCSGKSHRKQGEVCYLTSSSVLHFFSCHVLSGVITRLSEVITRREVCIIIEKLEELEIKMQVTI
jgi:hypothetical protein